MVIMTLTLILAIIVTVIMAEREKIEKVKGTETVDAKEVVGNKVGTVTMIEIGIEVGIEVKIMVTG
jgi:hypothetical protein